jgi:hypothetical protein
VETVDVAILMSVMVLKHGWGELVVIFADCVDLVALLDQVFFKHCSREANEIAHEIANNSFSTRNSYNWVDEPGLIICKLINNVIKR